MISPRLLVVLLAALVLGVSPAWAGPVEWVEVPATEAGQQWWDQRQRAGRTARDCAPC